MKIYSTITEALKEEITKLPGIYYFKNKINNKYYIGLALCIRKRFKSHCFNINNNNDINPLYKAIKEFGIDNFEYGIIGVIRTKVIDVYKIKKVLDEQETKYINKYNSYKSGYNQTIGGDGGILGYKMTEEQREKIRENSKNQARDGRFQIFVYNIKTKEEYSFSNFYNAAEKLNINKDSLYSSYRRNSLYKGYLLIKKTKEELYNSINTELNVLIKKCKKYSLEEYIKIKEKYPDISLPQLAKIMGICKKTIYNYENKLKNYTNGYKNILRFI